MGKRFLIDTNVIIYFLKNEIPEKKKSSIRNIFSSSFIISVISEIEFLGWMGFDEEEFNQANDFIHLAETINLSDEIVQRTINIKRRNKIKTPDAVIAATCLVNDSTLVTRNISDFAKIDGLRIYNPFAPEQKYKD